jgi:hypothetical protein
MRSVVYIDKNGDLSGLSCSVFDHLADLGERSVQRVSNIEFNHTLQLWEALDMEGNLIGTHRERDRLIEIEREYLNNKIEKVYAEKTA